MPDTSGWLALTQLALSAALVLVSAWYVRLTARISKASSDSAEAARMAANAAQQSAATSAAVLDEMRQQRFGAAQPLVFGTARAVASVNGVPTSVHVELRNAGSGPAIGVLGDLILDGRRYASRQAGGVGVLPASATESVELRLRAATRRPRQARGDLRGRLTVTYGDIYGRRFQLQLPVEMAAAGSTISASGVPRVSLM